MAHSNPLSPVDANAEAAQTQSEQRAPAQSRGGAGQGAQSWRDPAEQARRAEAALDRLHWAIEGNDGAQTREALGALRAILGEKLFAQQLPVQSPRGLDRLHWAAELGADQAAQALLDFGADPGARTAEEQETALIVACRKGHEKCARVLAPVSDLAAQSVDAATKKPHQTALHCAVVSGGAELVALVASPLAARVKNRLGNTALAEAVRATAHRKEGLACVKAIIPLSDPFASAGLGISSALSLSAFVGQSGWSDASEELFAQMRAREAQPAAFAEDVAPRQWKERELAACASLRSAEAEPLMKRLLEAGADPLAEIEDAPPGAEEAGKTAWSCAQERGRGSKLALMAREMEARDRPPKEERLRVFRAAARAALGAHQWECAEILAPFARLPGEQLRAGLDRAEADGPEAVAALSGWRALWEASQIKEAMAGPSAALGGDESSPAAAGAPARRL